MSLKVAETTFRQYQREECFYFAKLPKKLLAHPCLNACCMMGKLDPWHSEFLSC